MPVNIISDIAAAYKAVKANLASITSKSDNVIDKAMGNGNGEDRFFSRPMSSVARAAKKSILYFPVVVSDTVSAEGATTLAKVTQVRAAEYVRLMVENMGPISAASNGKAELISALRGATLKDSMLGEAVAANEHVKNLLSESIEHIFVENTINQPMEPFLLQEAKKKKPRQNVDDDDSWDDDQKQSGRHEKPFPHQAAHDKIIQDLIDSQKGRVATGRISTSTDPDNLNRLFIQDRLEAIGGLLDNGPIARREAERELTHLFSSDKLAGYDLRKAIEDYDSLNNTSISKALRAMEDKIDAEASRKHASDVARDRANVSPIEKERERQMERVQRAINLSGIKDAAGNPSGRAVAQAAQAIQELIAIGDPAVIAKLRANPDSKRILEMLERLPDGTIRDGVIDMSNTGNKVSTINNIDFHKLNQFQPVLLSLQIRYKNADNEPLTVMDTLTLGVKGVAHPVPSLDLVTGLGTALQRDSLLLQFFRMTSGETSFVKDFVLNLNVAKARSSARTTSGTKVLETLRRQTEWNMRRGNRVIASVAQRGFIPPTTTMVVTSEETDRIRNIYGVDFSKPSVTRELLRSHNLMGFIIIDEALGLVRVFEDGDDDFDRIPMATFKNQGKDTALKDVMTILAQGR